MKQFLKNFGNKKVICFIFIILFVVFCFSHVDHFEFNAPISAPISHCIFATEKW